MIFYALMNHLDFSISIVLAILVALKGNQRKLVLPFVFWTSAIAVWSLGVGMHAYFDSKSAEKAALFWSYFLHLGAVPIPAFYLHFVMTLCGKTQKTILYSNYLLTGFIVLMIPSEYFINGTAEIVSFRFFPKAGPLYPLYIFILFFCVVYSLVLLYKTFIESHGIDRNQILYVLLGSFIGYPLASTAFLPMFNIAIFPFGTPFVTLYAVLITYSIIRYKAMDLGLVIRWSLAYGISLLVVICISIVGIISIEKYLGSYLKIVKGVLSVLVGSLSIFMFDPLKKYITKMVDKFIFNSPEFEIILSGIKSELLKPVSLDNIAGGIVENFKLAWEVDHAGLALWDSSLSHFELYPKSSFNEQTINHLKVEISSSDFLVKTLETERRLFRYGILLENELYKLISRAMLGERTTFHKIRRSMRYLGAAACVPLMWETHLIGFIILGPKKNAMPYNDEDKKFLSHVGEVVSNSVIRLITNEARIEKSASLDIRKSSI